MNKYAIVAITTLCAAWADMSAAQDLVMGSKAPKLQVSKFIKGEPVKEFEKGKTYVVEFWATWCGPCIATIPHLTKLQKQYKDVTFIGVAIFEKDQDAVDEFVEKMGDKMDYRVALDSVAEDASPDDGAMAKNWMEPAGLQGIPAAFIVNGDGLIAWIGHPGEIDDPLEKVAQGKWDIAAEVKKAKKIAEERKKVQTVLTRLNKLFGDFQESGDPKELLKELDNAAREVPDRATQFSVIKFQVLAEPKGNVDQALELGAQLLESEIGDDSEALNNIAWMLVNPQRDKKPDPKLLKFALKVAQKADDLEKFEDPSIADTLAKAYFDNGMLEKAVETQERAVKTAPGTDLENDPDVKKRLRQYKRALESSKTEPAKK